MKEKGNLVLLSRLSSKSSSVPFVFKKVRLSRLFLLTLLWVDRLFCKTPPVVLYKVLCIKGLDKYQPPVRPHV